MSYKKTNKAKEITPLASVLKQRKSMMKSTTTNNDNYNPFTNNQNLMNDGNANNMNWNKAKW